MEVLKVIKPRIPLEVPDQYKERPQKIQSNFVPIHWHNVFLEKTAQTKVTKKRKFRDQEKDMTKIKCAEASNFTHSQRQSVSTLISTINKFCYILLFSGIILFLLCILMCMSKCGMLRFIKNMCVTCCCCCCYGKKKPAAPAHEEIPLQEVWNTRRYFFRGAGVI